MTLSYKEPPMRIALFLGIMLTLSACNGIEKFGTYDTYNHLTTDPIPVVMPANANYISEQFGRGGEIDGLPHEGIDIWGKVGTPIIAAAPGRVVASYYEPGHGNTVEVYHGRDTDGEQVKTIYKHLKTRTVQTGAQVARGEQVGTMGATGALAMLIHLHFEVRRASTGNFYRAYDPMLYWVQGPGRVTCFETGKTYATVPWRITYPVPCR